jgi:tRNA isopentenyl-2-thiomethyl-A-37 hydroxylase MiaE
LDTIDQTGQVYELWKKNPLIKILPSSQQHTFRKTMNSKYQTHEPEEVTDKLLSNGLNKGKTYFCSLK